MSKSLSRLKAAQRVARAGDRLRAAVERARRRNRAVAEFKRSWLPNMEAAADMCAQLSEALKHRGVMFVSRGQELRWKVRRAQVPAR